MLQEYRDNTGDEYERAKPDYDEDDRRECRVTSTEFGHRRRDEFGRDGTENDEASCKHRRETERPSDPEREKGVPVRTTRIVRTVRLRS